MFHQIVNEHGPICIYTDFAPAMGSQSVESISAFVSKSCADNDLKNMEFVFLRTTWMKIQPILWPILFSLSWWISGNAGPTRAPRTVPKRQNNGD